jgi:hypothetical protein
MLPFRGLIAVVVLLLYSSAHAADAPSSGRLAGLWATAGQGYPLHGSTAQYLSLAAASSSDKLFIARLGQSFARDAGVSPDVKVRDIGILVGELERISSHLLVYAALGGGSAQVTSRGRFLGYKRDASGNPAALEFATQRASAFAVMYEAHLLYAPIRYAAAGVTFFGDYNSKKSLTAATLSVHLGSIPLIAHAR